MAGYVGSGMLAAAVSGEVFASPSEEAVLAAIRAVTGHAGCLVIVMNYTGDRLNFGAACERAKAEGLKVEMVVSADDCALQSNGVVGRRGIAGSIFVHKIAGAAAAAGGSLADVKAAAEAAAANVGSLGASLTSCTLFGQPAEQRLGPDELEMGLGIHGEPGAYREKIRPLSDIVHDLVTRIAADTGCYLPIEKGERVALLVNNLGSTTPLEMNAAARAAARLVEARLQARLERLFVGPFMTSLDMHGLSLSLLRIPDDATLALLDAPTQALAWPATPPIYSGSKLLLPLPTGATDDPAAATEDGGQDGEVAAATRRCLEAVCKALAEAEGELNALDAKVGDGDCGSTLAKGAAAVQQQLGALPLADPAAAAVVLARLAGHSLGGTSGAVYKILLTGTGASLAEQRRQTDGAAPTLADLAAALSDGAAAVGKYGGAQLGSRTMLDAVVPAAKALHEAAAAGQPAAAALAAAAAAAAAGAEATKGMAAAAGRSSYVPASLLSGSADPGAVAVARWMAAAAAALA
ncbi:3,4-dihydroxy-2-butanone kinase [Micractinium conductrix]|uniref:3,4-dihydroxy-2-butanone kinase n=1 Tax=Micractinium conductrix TaxID=554055 RepID=A0A2P6V360_9CHLO|nr:3,4-dihydroxy-2-butanone kinase [Micractinium conductrix]|eukprot:PSC68530.1 3,4-dihydroxy-2-butanone kinase [Micractinium conductrix]